MSKPSGLRTSHFSAIVSTILSAIVFAGCLGDRVAGGTGVGNPTKGSVSVAMQAVPGGALAKRASNEATGAIRQPEGSFPIRDVSGTVFTVQSCHANVGNIRLALPEHVDCEDADETDCEAGEVTIPGPMVADLMAGSWSPDPGAIRIPVGAYNRMDIRLEAADEQPSGPVPDLAGHSLIIKGIFAYSGRSDRAFTLALDFDEDARFLSDTGFVVHTGSSRITVALDVEKWLSAADITGCLDTGKLILDALGNLTVNEDNSCSGLDNAIKDAIKESGRIEGKHED